MIMTLSSIGLAGLNGFVGEFLVLLGSVRPPIRWPRSWRRSGVILAAVYMLWMFQRVMFGPVTNPENEKLRDLSRRELPTLVPVLLLIFWIGIYPKPFLETRMWRWARSWSRLGRPPRRRSPATRITPRFPAPGPRPQEGLAMTEMVASALAIRFDAIFPEAILAAVASVVLVVSAGRQGKVGRVGLWLSLAGCLAAMVAAWMVEPGEPVFGGSWPWTGSAGSSTSCSPSPPHPPPDRRLRRALGSGERRVLRADPLRDFGDDGDGFRPRSHDDLPRARGGLDHAIHPGRLPVARTRSTEASVKYFLLGAFATGFLLYGIALAYGATGTTDLREIAAQISGHEVARHPLLLAGLGLTPGRARLQGLGRSVPHVDPGRVPGRPDRGHRVHGLGPKVAVFAALLRILLVGFRRGPSRSGRILWWLAVLTMVVGNILALVQRDMKRLLAYSAIAHAGYLLVALLAGAELGGIGVLYYLVVYTLTTLGAFGVVALVRERGWRNRRSTTSPAWVPAPLARLGHVALHVLAGRHPPHRRLRGEVLHLRRRRAGRAYSLAVIGVMASLVSVYYYLRVVVRCTCGPPRRGSRLCSFPIPPTPWPSLSRWPASCSSASTPAPSMPPPGRRWWGWGVIRLQSYAGIGVVQRPTLPT